MKRWKLAIQHYDFRIEHIAGVDNIVADGITRWCDLPEVPTQLLNYNFTLEERTHMIPSAIYKQLQLYHNSSIGHMGVEATINKLAAHDLTWPTMREDVLTFIGRCPACQKMSQLKHHIHMSPFTTVSYGPMNRLNIDSIGPFPVDEAGNKYIITIIDAFTRWCMLIPTVDATAISAADALVKWMGIFGIPSSIVSRQWNTVCELFSHYSPRSTTHTTHSHQCLLP